MASLLARAVPLFKNSCWQTDRLIQKHISSKIMLVHCWNIFIWQQKCMAATMANGENTELWIGPSETTGDIAGTTFMFSTDRNQTIWSGGCRWSTALIYPFGSQQVKSACQTSRNSPSDRSSQTLKCYFQDYLKHVMMVFDQSWTEVSHCRRKGNDWNVTDVRRQ